MPGSACFNERLRLIAAPVGEIERKLSRDWREKLFKSPRPRGWFPNVGERVYLRPGISLGAQLHTEAEVWRVYRAERKVDVRVHAPGGRWKTRVVGIGDVRPKESSAPRSA